MMAKTLGTPVLCSRCGKELRGTIGVGRGFHVRWHKKPDGSPCTGHWSTNHRPAPRKADR